MLALSQHKLKHALLHFIVSPVQHYPLIGSGTSYLHSVLKLADN